MAEFSENRHISNLINMSCKVDTVVSWSSSSNFLFSTELKKKDLFSFIVLMEFRF